MDPREPDRHRAPRGAIPGGQHRPRRATAISIPRPSSGWSTSATGCKVNGEAIYATRPWTTMEGRRRRPLHPQQGRQVRLRDCLSWPGKRLVLDSVRPEPGSRVTMLGVAKPLEWSFREKQCLVIEVPEKPSGRAEPPVPGRVGLQDKRQDGPSRVTGRAVGETADQHRHRSFTCRRKCAWSRTFDGPRRRCGSAAPSGTSPATAGRRGSCDRAGPGRGTSPGATRPRRAKPEAGD